MPKMTYIIELSMNHINNIPIQKEEIETLKSSNEQQEKKIVELNNELSNISLSNRNFLIEISTLNKLLNDYMEENEKYHLQANYYKKENVRK